MVNAIAGAHAESSPVVVISGAPGVREQREDPLIHHRFGPFTFQREIFERITCATAVLDDPLTAFRQIDRTIEAARYHSKPVYIELPRDMVDVPGFPVPYEPLQPQRSQPDALKEAVGETLQQLRGASAPVVLAGLEVHRRGLQDELGASCCAAAFRSPRRSPASPWWASAIRPISASTRARWGRRRCGAGWRRPICC